MNWGRCSGTLSKSARPYVDPESNIASESEIIHISLHLMGKTSRLLLLSYTVSIIIIPLSTTGSPQWFSSRGSVSSFAPIHCLKAAFC